jgi:hypothetical protein
MPNIDGSIFDTPSGKDYSSLFPQEFAIAPRTKASPPCTRRTRSIAQIVSLPGAVAMRFLPNGASTMMRYYPIGPVSIERTDRAAVMVKGKTWRASVYREPHNRRAA